MAMSGNTGINESAALLGSPSQSWWSRVTDGVTSAVKTVFSLGISETANIVPDISPTPAPKPTPALLSGLRYFLSNTKPFFKGDEVGVCTTQNPPTPVTVTAVKVTTNIPVVRDSGIWNRGDVSEQRHLLPSNNRMTVNDTQVVVEAVDKNFQINPTNQCSSSVDPIADTKFDTDNGEILSVEMQFEENGEFVALKQTNDTRSPAELKAAGDPIGWKPEGWNLGDWNITWQDGCISAAIGAAPVVIQNGLVRIFGVSEKNAETTTNFLLNGASVATAVVSGNYLPSVLNGAATGFGLIADCIGDDKTKEQSNCAWAVHKLFRGAEYGCKATSVVIRVLDNVKGGVVRMTCGVAGNLAMRGFFKVKDYCCGKKPAEKPEEELLRAASESAEVQIIRI